MRIRFKPQIYLICRDVFDDLSIIDEFREEIDLFRIMLIGFLFLLVGIFDTIALPFYLLAGIKLNFRKS